MIEPTGQGNQLYADPNRGALVAFVAQFAQGWSENTSNMRVLVTFLDGEQRVVELTNDFGVSRSVRKDQLMQMLAQQGVTDVSDVSLSD